MMSTERNTSRAHKSWPLIALITIGMAALTSCSNPVDESDGEVAIGENGTVGDIDLLNFLLVTTAEGEPGRFLGVIENETDQPVDVTISDSDDDVTISVPADSQLGFDTNEILFNTADDAPGANTKITVTAGNQTTDLTVPVLDGTLDQYEPYLPE